MWDHLKRHLASRFGERVLLNEPLAKYCNWRIGGPADFFLTARSRDELELALKIAHKCEHRPTVLGFGANVLVSDSGIRGLVIQNRAHRITFEADSKVLVDSGTNLAVLAKEAAAKGVGGLEFLVGIPGTIGAAVAVNAGTQAKWMSSVLEDCDIFNKNGEIENRVAQELDFSYRYSNLKDSGETVLTARLRGTSKTSESIGKALKDELKVRKTQPTGPSTGSVFTNPPGDFAGRLIEACGLKGFQIGGAQVAEMHANFILNKAQATAQDVKAVIAHIKTRVAKEFDIQLKEEIRYLGDWG